MIFFPKINEKTLEKFSNLGNNGTGYSVLRAQGDVKRGIVRRFCGKEQQGNKAEKAVYHATDLTVAKGRKRNGCKQGKKQ